MQKAIISILLLLAIFNAQIGLCQKNEKEKPESFEALDIRGLITSDKEKIADVILELWEDNEVIESIETKKNGKFKFRLENNHIYTIQLSKKGYYTKRISVNTHLPEDVKNRFEFEFDINIDSKKDNQFDESLSEYPSALIAYNKKRKKFYFDKDYTKTYFNDIQEDGSGGNYEEGDDEDDQ
ncbi:MAG: hypothetical protein R2813_07745 [Flavobacteriales bacterium]